MGKTRRGDKEYTREQKLVHENKQLKRQVSQLRKQISKLDIDRYENLKEVIEQHYQQDRVAEGRVLMEKVRQEWKCHVCNEGHLEIVKYNKGLETWYYRKCSKCTNRTVGKRFKEDVDGVFKDLGDTSKQGD